MTPGPGRGSGSLRPPQFLQSLPETGRDAVLSATRTVRLGRGELLVRQGDPAESLFLVESGTVAVRYSTGDGEQLMLTVLGPGELLGEIGLLVGHSRRTASAQAMRDVVARELTMADLDLIRARHPAANDFMLQLLARRAERLTRLVAESLHLPVEARVARRLLELGAVFLGDTMPVVLPLTQDDVAQLAGTTRPTTNGVLQRLAAEGVLRLARGRIEIHDPAGLRARCALTGP